MSITKDDEIIRRGLNSYPEIYYPSDDFITTLKEYQELPAAKKQYGIHNMKIEDAMYDAQQFLQYYYKLHNIPTVSIKKLLGVQIHIGRTISPLKLPIKLVPSDDIFSGAVKEVFTNQKQHILFREINLNSTITEHTSASYVHEITHTQLDRMKGTVREYYNLEVISIFNELFHASILDKDERILRLNDSRRIHEMAVTAEELQSHKNGIYNMSREELLESCKYLISDIKAYNLFVLFYNANDTIKNEILDDIQSIFDGYLTVEELLLKYDITLESSQKNPQILKYLSR